MVPVLDETRTLQSRVGNRDMRTRCESQPGLFDESNRCSTLVSNDSPCSRGRAAIAGARGYGIG
jgi:hypothetical protein